MAKLLALMTIMVYGMERRHLKLCFFIRDICQKGGGKLAVNKKRENGMMKKKFYYLFSQLYSILEYITYITLVQKDSYIWAGYRENVHAL